MVIAHDCKSFFLGVQERIIAYATSKAWYKGSYLIPHNFIGDNMTINPDTKTAAVTWQGEGLTFTAEVGSGYTFVMDSKAGEQGGSPMEFLLASVAGCTAMDVVSILQKMRQAVSGVQVTISGTRASNHPRVYTQAMIHFTISGHDVAADAVARAIKLSQENYCSASILFARAGVTIETDFTIEAR
jgi:putative redox protein